MPRTPLHQELLADTFCHLLYCYDLSGHSETRMWWSPWGLAGLVKQASAQRVGKGSGLNVLHWPTSFHLLCHTGKGSSQKGDGHQCE